MNHTIFNNFSAQICSFNYNLALRKASDKGEKITRAASTTTACAEAIFCFKNDLSRVYDRSSLYDFAIRIDAII